MLASYFAIKHLHITCVILSISLFILRFYWHMNDSAQLQKKWVRIAPHIIDTLLLLSAISLAWISHQVPFVQAWLGAKIVALIVYIALGSMALKKTKPHRRTKSSLNSQTRLISFLSFIAALCVFAYIVSVALSKKVIPFI